VIGEQQVRNTFQVELTIVAERIESLETLQLPKIVAFDIETASTGIYPDVKNDAIIFIAVYSEAFQRVITWKRFATTDPTYVFVDSEAALIVEFIKTLKELRPQLLVGYGSDSFDWPYIAARAKKYNIAIDLSWDGSELTLASKGKKRAKFIGLPYADLIHFIRRILDLDTDHYGLDVVAKKLIGKGKLSTLSAKKINEMWSVGLAEELRFLADYNLTDAQLTYYIAKKLLPIQAELSKLTGLPLQEVAYLTYGALVEWYIIKNYAGLIPPKPSTADIMARQRRSYIGAFVFEPKPGFYKNICCFDFRSLYPSIMASHNISPETLTCSCCQFRSGFRVDEKIWFCSKRQGFIPTLVKELVERRKRINEILRQTQPTELAFAELMARQHALKYIAVAFYGYLGFPASRFYSYECASAITELGRKYINLVIKEAEKFDLKVLYGDTDSLFVEINNKEQASEFLQIVNSILPPPMELELRAIYKAGLFLGRKSGVGGAKKRYALLTEGNSLLLRGLEAIRGDWSALAKRSQKEILQIILEEGDVQKAFLHLQSLIQQVRDRKVSLADLVVNVRLTRPLQYYKTQTPHIVAAKLAEEKGYPVKQGFIVSYIIVSGKSNKISSRVKLAEDCKIEEYDVEYYINQQLLGATYKIFELFGYDLEKLGGSQKTLEGY
ncbi:MAG: DNA-directed DNA polymerase, partial [Candidatus Nanoarchaeia archaeon]